MRVAVVIYGLVRHNCTRVNFERAWIDPLRRHNQQRQQPQSYQVDVFISGNVASAESEKDAEGAQARHYAMHSNPALWWEAYRPCIAEFVDQDVFTGMLHDDVHRTCGTYGERWPHQRHQPKCTTTLNYFRALHAQERATSLIQRHELRTHQRYDMVANARIDVLFTHVVAAPAV